MTEVPFWVTVRQDVCAQVPIESQRRKQPIRSLLICFIFISGFRCIFLFRLSSLFRNRVPFLGTSISRIVTFAIRRWYMCSLGSTARLGGGIVLPHPQGIIIGGNVQIEGDCWIFQNVTIGGRPGDSGQPNIGFNARIYTGAVLSGGITLGRNVVVGANSVVSFDVADDAIVRAARSTIQLPNECVS